MLFLMLFSLTSAFAQEDCGKFQHKWETCRRNRDCVVVIGACGMETAVNRKYRKQFEAYISCMDNGYNVCPNEEGAVTERKSKAVCEGQCLVR